MLGRATQSGSCICHCFQSWVPAFTAMSVRGVHHNNTWVFERLWPVLTPRKHNQPQLKRRHRVLIPQHPQLPDNRIKCILTQEVGTIGFKGDVVEVSKRNFRYRLQPSGQAIYASPENLAANEEYLKSEEAQKYKGISIKAKHMMDRLSGYHLHIPMNSKNIWVLNKTHVKVALRLAGIIVDDECLTLPDKPVTEPGEVIIDLTLNRQLRTQMRCTVYHAEDNSPVDPDLQLPEQWGNPPVNKDNPVQLINL